MGVASSAADARVMLEALEIGTAGVLLRTQDPVQVLLQPALHIHVVGMSADEHALHANFTHVPMSKLVPRPPACGLMEGRQ
jgi:3-dehydroquinate synthase class II